MKIIDKVLAMQAIILAGGLPAAQNRERAVNACTGGITSGAWRTYMSHFADTPEQLERLLGTDGTGDNLIMIEKRAYLVGNGICGEGSGQGFAAEVDSIDNDLPLGTACGPTP